MKLFGRCAALLMAALVLLSACTSDTSSKYYQYDGSINPPKLIAIADRKPAANFTGSLLSGKGDYDLNKDAKGKITVINFWGAWCPPCQIETPNFQRVYQAFQSKGVTFVGIDIKEASRGKPMAFVEQYKITYPMVYDDEGRVAVTVGNLPTQGAPYSMVLDRAHRVAGFYVGAIDPKALTKMLTTLVAEKQ